MKPTITTPRYKPPLPAIRLGSPERHGSQTRYGTLLVWFMRALSLLWMLQGLLHWTAILNADDDGRAALETMSSLGIAAVAFFSVIDFVAAVGLWLATSWGGVVWLVAVAAQCLTTVMLPGFFSNDLVTTAAGLALMIGYFLLIYQAARENAPYV